MQTLESLRTEINHIDSELIRLLWERFRVVEKVGKLKKQEKIPALQNDRWKQVLSKVITAGKEYNIPPDCTETIWNAIHEAALEKENTILQK